ncbi:LysR family transcriptional regulator [Agrobacterium tumefaciens]|uniref:HTH-type transcriptional regulator TtuA n=1 Tax=Agrobacterium tumefaciens TaxID=358 RepID=A0A2L2LMS8_AGRTU|nr:LysR family transcriptional regulator [Agrobacterium tumefaciens]AVH45632.1 LysR family transcriptional regulator [Agrobacterium tumefaciens]NSY99292.1 LysR family transcriptional regulator [Agrobacterium tumefaciens]
MNLRQLESFLAIANLGNFAAAAERLCVTQSTISARIQELEQILGVELFDRSQRTARLTLKGRELRPYAEQVVELTSEIRRMVGAKAALAGVMRVGVAELVAISWLPDLVGAVRDEYPNIKLEFEVGLNPFLLDGIRSGSLDFAMIAGRIAEPGLTTFDLGCVPFSWMASPILVPGAQPFDLCELRKMPILYQGTNSFTNSMMDQLLGISSNRDRKGMTCNSLEAIYSLTRSGVGVGFLPVDRSAALLRDGVLKVLRTTPSEFEMPFSVAFASSSPALFNDIAQLCVRTSKFRSDALTAQL